MGTYSMSDSNNNNVDSRLSRLETIIDNISDALVKIEHKLDGNSKINWAPIAIGVTVFFTVAGSVSTVYNARISTMNTAVEMLATRMIDQEKGAVERQLRIESTAEKVERLEKDVESLDDRVNQVERKTF